MTRTILQPRRHTLAVLRRRPARKGRETASVIRTLLAALTILIFTSDLRAADAVWRLVEEHWYILQIQSRPAGWSSALIYEDEAGERYRGETSTTIEVERGSVPISMEIGTTFIETRDGRPVLMRLRQVMSQQPVESEWRFEDERVIEVTKQGGREMTRQHPPPEGTWLTPRASRRFMRERMAAGADEITVRTIEPTRGLEPVRVHSIRGGEGTFEIDGREIPVTIWRTTSDEIAPLEAIERYSSDGYMVYQELPIGIGRLEMRRVSREEAQAARGMAAPELFFESFVRPDRPIRNVMQSRRLALRLRTKEGEMPELPSAGAQRVEREEGGRSAIITIDLDHPLPATEQDLSHDDYLAASPLIDSDDALVQALARRAVREVNEAKRDDPASRAEAMRAFVERYITNKGLDTAFASASETARTRAGDCSEHAVLLAAMLRAGGIPARTASGLMYIDEFLGERGVFGWHMWTQALIDGAWIDLDPTLPVPYHAAHILTSTSSLAHSGTGGGGAEHTSILLLIGNLEIDVLSAE